MAQGGTQALTLVAKSRYTRTKATMGLHPSDFLTGITSGAPEVLLLEGSGQFRVSVEFHSNTSEILRAGKRPLRSQKLRIYVYYVLNSLRVRKYTVAHPEMPHFHTWKITELHGSKGEFHGSKVFFTSLGGCSGPRQFVFPSFPVSRVEAPQYSPESGALNTLESSLLNGG